MLTFFKKFRKSLIDSGSARKYILYAFGEILLVMIGILLALQVNNWNIAKSEINNFDLILDEIEDNIRLDSTELSTDIKSLSRQINYLENVLLDGADIKLDSLNIFLEYFLANRWADFHSTGINQLRTSKNINVVSPELIEWINRYYTVFENLQNKLPHLWVQPTEDFRQYLIQNELPPPPLNEADLEKFKNELENSNFRNRLKHILSSKKDQFKEFSYSLNYAKALLNVLSNNRTINFSVAIIGTGTGKGWDTDIVMEKLDKYSWHAQISLVEGEIKFRLKDSWFQNWGGNSFPKGKSILDGPNIPVEEGLYNVVFNTQTGVYQFENINTK